MHDTRRWLRELRRRGFQVKRNTGGHAQFALGSILVTVPVHQRELPKHVIAAIKRALARVAGGD